MRGPEDRVDRFVNGILRNRRPARFKATEEEAAAMRGALRIRAAHLSASRPDPEFVRRLERRVLFESGALAPPVVRLTRRALLRGAGTAAAAVLAGAAIDHALGAAGAPAGSADLEPDGGDWRPLASVSALPVGEA